MLSDDSDQDELSPQHGNVEVAPTTTQLRGARIRTPADESAPRGSRHKRNRRKRIRNRNKSEHGTGSFEVDNLSRTIRNMMMTPAEQEEPALELPSSSGLAQLSNDQVDYPEDRPELQDLTLTDDLLQFSQRNIIERQATVKSSYPTQVGIGMSKLQKDGDVIYFAFTHDFSYQQMHHLFLESTTVDQEVNLSNARRFRHMEQLLECADVMFRRDMIPSALSILREILSTLQHAVHSELSFQNVNHRLEYTYVENRIFLVTALKYLHVMKMNGSYKIVLDIAKLLLSLDRSDPLCIMMIIDIAALNAEEYVWLLKFINYWKVKGNEKRLFNLKYSSALANYHLSKARGHSTCRLADTQIREAFCDFPLVGARLLEEASEGRAAVLSYHPVFNESIFKNYRIPDRLKAAINIYAKLASNLWQEPDVLIWMTRNALEVLHRYLNQDLYRKMYHELATRRNQEFLFCPIEIQRHMVVIRSMNRTLFRGEIIRLERYRAWDPLPPALSVDRYEYDPKSKAVDRKMLIDFFISMMPDAFPEKLRQSSAPTGASTSNEGASDSSSSSAGTASANTTPANTAYAITASENTASESAGTEPACTIAGSSKGKATAGTLCKGKSFNVKSSSSISSSGTTCTGALSAGTTSTGTSSVGTISACTSSKGKSSNVKSSSSISSSGTTCTGALSAGTTSTGTSSVGTTSACTSSKGKSSKGKSSKGKSSKGKSSKGKSSTGASSKEKSSKGKSSAGASSPSSAAGATGQPLEPILILQRARFVGTMVNEAPIPAAVEYDDAADDSNTSE